MGKFCLHLRLYCISSAAELKKMALMEDATGSSSDQLGYPRQDTDVRKVVIADYILDDVAIEKPFEANLEVVFESDSHQKAENMVKFVEFHLPQDVLMLPILVTDADTTVQRVGRSQLFLAWSGTL